MRRSFADIKKEARGRVHDHLRVSAIYLPSPYTAGQPVTIRPHEKWDALGDMQGTSMNYAEMTETKPKLIFLVSEVAMPERLAIVSIAPGFAFMVDATDPVDGITITAHCSRMTATQIASYFPDGQPIPEPL